MPRPLRIHVPGALYHITLRGNHRQDIFFAPADRQRMSNLFAEVLQRFRARLHAYCYMSNHLHALIQVSDVPLGNLILRIAGQYARGTQAHLQTTGHLFEKRYYPVLVDADTYLLELLRYVHLNPVRAGLATSPENYPWSSHHVYVGKRDEPWVTTDFALSMFHSERGRAVSAYQRFVHAANGNNSASSPLEECNPNDRRILGSDDFARGLLGSTWKRRSQETLEDLIAEACARFGVSALQLGSPGRKKPLVAARAWVAQQALNGRVASIAMVARRFNRDESSLRHALNTHFPS